ncbi:MAG: IS1634 family transposase [Candidatus Brocadiae bacterium]|nr:IS1634 family transposase [Candidatus Brocadiia bacterium]
MKPQPMNGRIVSAKRNGKTYYSYMRTYRVKIDSNQQGKTRGSGKSKVVTESYYLGTAEMILEKLTHEKPVEIYNKAFGLPCALWKMVQEIGLIDIVNRVVPGKRDRQVSLGEYIAIAAINQVGHTASKRALAKWYESTVLPRITGISKEQLSSQHFWNAFDEIVSEQALQDKKIKEKIQETRKLEFEELERILDDSRIEAIEEELWQVVAKKFDLCADVILYDATNFYTFMDECTAANIPQRCGSNKQKRFDKRQIGLALAVLRPWGIPIFHQIYGGQTNEQCLFTTVISTLVNRYHKIAGSAKKPVLIFDQGSNSQEHFDTLSDKVHFIAALSPSDYPHLAAIPMKEYKDGYRGEKYYSQKSQIYQREALVVMTFSEPHKKRDHRAFRKQLEKVYNALNTKIRKHSTGNLDELKQEIQYSLGSMKISSAKASEYLEIKDNVSGGGIRSLKVVCKRAELARKRLTFGKRIIFTDMLELSPEAVLREYQGKQVIEDDFKILKDRQYVSFWPMYHWTDTKIRVHSFVTVLALLLVKLVEFQVRAHGLQISGKALVNELQDMTESLLVYNPKDAERKLCTLTTNQKEIFSALGLESFL